MFDALCSKNAIIMKKVGVFKVKIIFSRNDDILQSDYLICQAGKMFLRFVLYLCILVSDWLTT